MAHVPIADVVPGQVTACDIHNFHGQRLLSKGAVLTPRVLRVLKSWGISSVDIELQETHSEHVSSSDHASPELLEESAAAIRPLFRHNDLAHPFIDEVLRIAVSRHAKSGG